jgi:O-antigen/teichoic acid export membrane protein
MQPDEPRARIGYQSGAISRAKEIALKAIVVVGGAVMLVSAFVLSLTFIAIGLAVVLTFGGYLWWKTRGLRKQIRERRQSYADGDFIEGEVISRDERPADRR